MNGINLDLLKKIRDNRRKDRYRVQRLIDEHNFYGIKFERLPIINLPETKLEKIQEIKRNLKVAVVKDGGTETVIPLTLYFDYNGPINLDDNGDLKIGDFAHPYTIALSTKIDDLPYDKEIEYKLYNIKTPIPTPLKMVYQEHNPYTNQRDCNFYNDLFNKVISPLKINGYLWRIESYQYDKNLAPLSFPLIVILGDKDNAYNILTHTYVDNYYQNFTKNIQLLFNEEFKYSRYAKFE